MSVNNLITPSHRGATTYANQEVRVGAMEVGNTHDRRHSLRVTEDDVQRLGKLVLGAEGLQHKDTHPQHSLLGWVVFRVEGMVQDDDDIVEDAACVDEISPEPLIALDELPQEADQLWRPRDRFFLRECIGVDG